MKKNFIKFMALVAVALPMAFLSSCGDDDDDINNGKDENTGQTIKEVDIKMDGVDFVKKNWLNYDDNGNVTGTAIGKAIYEAEPTVVYVGVENMEDALAHFNSAVRPVKAEMKSVNGNWQVVLVDTLGNEQNIIHFDKVEDGTVLAKAYLDKTIGIESYISEIRYIPISLWPENALGSNSPFRAGCVYTFKGKNYACVRSFGYGKDGLLVCDINNYTWLQCLYAWTAERNTANYPNANTCKEIRMELSNSVSGPRFWQLLCACAGQTDLKQFKTREYWTCTTSGYDICVMNFASNSDGKFVEARGGKQDQHYIGVTLKSYSSWELYVYRFKVNEKGETSVWKSNNGIWLDEVEDRTPKASEFVRNEKLEQESEKISK